MELNFEIIGENDREPPMVTVWCRTFHHAAYIRDALDGFLAQQTDFYWRVIVFDDCSTDGTREIVREYAQKYPALFRAVLPDRNTYHLSNSKDITWGIWEKYLTGKYIAWCEGDDFWIDRHKLQLQVEYMERNPTCSVVLHDALWIDMRNYSFFPQHPYYGPEEKDLSAQEVIMHQRRHPAVSSVVNRREYLFLPDVFQAAPASDYAMQLYWFSQGSVHYFDRVMSVYRWNAAGSYTSRLTEQPEFKFYFDLGMATFFSSYDRLTEFRYHPLVQNKIQMFLAGAIQDAGKEMSLQEAYQKSIEAGYRFPEGSGALLNRAEPVRRQVFEEDGCPLETQTFAKSCRHLVIMGKGKYAGIITRQLDKSGIPFDGYAVTRKKDGDGSEFQGKPLWELKCIPVPKEDMGLLIAIDPLCWDEILRSLDECQIQNYFCPFLVEDEEASWQKKREKYE